MKIVALTVTKRPYLLLNVSSILENQSRKPDGWMVVIHSDAGTDIPIPKSDRRCEFIVLPRSETLGQIRNKGIEEAVHKFSADYVAMVDDDDWYGPGYFLDLENSILSDAGDVYGIREYDLGFVQKGVRPDGSNILQRRTCHGGEVLEGNRVTWVSGATVCVNTKRWEELGLRYRKPVEFTPTTSPDGSVGGEDGGLWEECKKKDAVIIRRPSTNFVACRVIAQDGWGGAHGHTWGPLHQPKVEPPPRPAPPAPAPAPSPAPAPPKTLTLEEAIRAVVQAVNTKEDRNFPTRIYIRRARSAKEIPLSRLGTWVVEDPSLPPGVLQVRDETGKIYETIQLPCG